MAELQTAVEKLEKFIDSFPSEELTANHEVMHHSRDPATVADIIDSLASDDQDHSRQIEEWLNKPYSGYIATQQPRQPSPNKWASPPIQVGFGLKLAILSSTPRISDGVIQSL